MRELLGRTDGVGFDAAVAQIADVTAEAEIFRGALREEAETDTLHAAGDEEAILARMRRFADAGVTDLSVRLLPIGDNRDELIASKRRTRAMISELGAQLR